MPGIVWIAIIGGIAGIIARFLLPGPNNPQVPLDDSVGERRLLRRHLPWAKHRLVPT
jgi:hypothetical protein